jgi:hypothetical protein
MIGAEAMRRLLPFLACLMVILTSWSGMAHAAEVAGGSIAGVELTFHAVGDGDEVPADSDNGLPHHHTVCHGHDIGHPAPGPVPAVYTADGQRPMLLPVHVLAPAGEDVALRPPQA